MNFINDKSIFLQIADNISEKVVSGIYKSGEKIPSVRELAADMGVNPTTIMRAFNELQHMEIIENKRGIGYYVKKDAVSIIQKHKKNEFFEAVLPEFLRQARMAGVSQDELKKQINF
ncbi:MAG: GntR family transcriptional regulator [Reichenbachiella sp.]